MAKKKHTIKVLETEKEQVRERRNIHIKAKDERGVRHIMQELEDNSDDELMAVGSEKKNKGKKMVKEIWYDEQTRNYRISDCGGGIPHEGLVSSCTRMYASGKYEKGEDSHNKFAGGENGVGMTLANFLSDYMTVESCQNGIRYTVELVDGELVSENKEKISKSQRGTTVTLKVSDRFFKDVDKVTCKMIMADLKDKADIMPGVVTKFHGITKKGKEIEETYVGYEVDELLKVYDPHVDDDTIVTLSMAEKEMECNLSFGYNKKISDASATNVHGWMNYIKNHIGGSHVDGLVDGFHKYMKEYIEGSILTKAEKKSMKVRKEDVKLGLCGIIAVRSVESGFVGQFKEEVDNKAVYKKVVKLVYNSMSKISGKKKKALVDAIRLNIKTRLNSERARMSVKSSVKTNGLKDEEIKSFYPTSIKSMGLIDFRELYICEGDSASSAVATGRVGGFQAVLGIRGKINNAYELPIPILIKKDIVKRFIKVIGAPPGRSDLIKWDIVNILTDADVDGWHIRTLLVILFLRLYPKFVEEGRLQIVEAPLYSFKGVDGEIVYVKDSREYAECMNSYFCRDYDLYTDGKKLSETRTIGLLDRNFDYINRLDKLSASMIANSELVEHIMFHIEETGYKKSSVPKWKKILKTVDKLGELKVNHKNDSIVITGMYKNDYHMIQLSDELMNSKRTVRFLSLLNDNMGIHSGFSIVPKKKKNGERVDDLTIRDVLKYFDSFNLSGLKIYKGLGTMNSDILAKTCTSLENRSSIRVTTADAEKALQDLNIVHSKAASADKSREKWVDQLLAAVSDSRDITA